MESRREPKSEQSWTRRVQLPIGLVLAGVLMMSMLVLGGGLSMYLGRIAEDTASTSMAEKGRLLLDRAIDTVDAKIAEATRVAAVAAELIEEVGPDAGLHAFEQPFRALYRTAPGLGLLAFDHLDGRWLAVHSGTSGPSLRTGSADGNPRIEGLLAKLIRDDSNEPRWLEPADPARPRVGDFEYLHPVLARGEVVGVVRVGLNILMLSRSLEQLDDSSGQRSFVLLGDRVVVAHPNLTTWQPEGPSTPLPQFEDVGDEALAAIWTPTEHRLDMFGDVSGHVDRLAGGIQRFAYIYREIDRSGAPPLLVGSHFPARLFGASLRDVSRARAGAGFVLALVAIGGFFLGRSLGGPIGRLAGAARSLGAFDLDAVPSLRGSVFREIDQAERAFDGAARGLRAFARYVPRELVRRLSQPGAVGAVRSESRDVTVLFTDLVGYTTATAALGPEETARFLNEHFERVTACIESEGGTVDKFIGDSVMAFWGAPTPQPDHAERAVRAARLIADAVRDEASPGEPSRVRLRVGLASGNVIVGDIGSRSRTSYTVIGDTVNIASRLEQQGKVIDPDAEIVALASGETIDQLLDRDDCQPLGVVELRGRPAPIEVFRVV